MSLERHRFVVEPPVREAIQITSAAGLAWMKEAMRSAELISRKNGLWAVVHFKECSGNGASAVPQEIHLINVSESKGIRGPGFYY